MTPATGSARSGQFTGPAVVRRADLLGQGLSDNHIRRARRLGLLTAILPGVYQRESPADQLDRRSAHRAALEAVLGRIGGDPVVSHESAALLHGLPLPDRDQSVVHVIRAGAAKSRRGVRFSAHRASLGPDDIVRIDGLAVTSLARTVVDCAVLLPRAEALPMAAAALDADRVTAAALTTQLARHARVPGVRAAAAVIGLAIDGAEREPAVLHPRVVIRTCAPVFDPPDSHR